MKKRNIILGIVAVICITVAICTVLILNKNHKKDVISTNTSTVTTDDETTLDNTTSDSTNETKATTEAATETPTEAPTEKPTEAPTEAPTLVNISATVSDGTYYIGDNLSVNKITVIAEYSNGGKIIDVEGWSANNLKLSSSSNTIKISYGDKTCTVTVKAIKKKSEKPTEKPTEAPTKSNNVVEAKIKDDTNYLVTKVAYTNGVPDPGKTVFSYRQLHLREGSDPYGVELAKAFLKYPLIANVMKGKNVINYSADSGGSDVVFNYTVEVKEGEYERYAFSFDDYDIYGTFVFDGVYK
ncbi:MAG: hypothetical protein PUA49_00870 [Butyrivibrio sp.]|nr:hypothetical protein [Butyrivibrio sp.]